MNTLKILFVEDLPTDMVIAQRALKRENIHFTYQVVETKDGFDRALKEFQPDLVISDYAMPMFDGITALEMTRSQADYIPFIMLTGSLNEETAVACMKAGADDYVIKEKIRRLPFAVREVMEMARARSERIQMHANLRQSEEKYRLLVDSITEGLVQSDNDGRILYVNQALCDMFGYSEAELIGQVGDVVLILDEDQERLRAINTMRQDVPSDRYEIRGKKKSGELIWLSISGSTVRDEQGNAIGSVGLFMDITDHKRAELALLESETRKRSYFEQSPYGVFIANSQGAYFEVNAKACELTGFSEDELLNMRIPDTLLAEDLDIGLQHFAEVKRTGHAFGEMRYRTKSGTIRWWSVAATKISEDLLLGFCADITERKLAEEALATSRKRLESFLHISQSMTASSDQVEIMQMIVDNATRVMGVDSGAIYVLSDQDNLRLTATTPPLPAGLPESAVIAHLHEHPHIARAIESRTPVVMPDSETAELSPAERTIAELRKLRSNLYVPIQVKGHVFGVLILSSIEEKHAFTEEEISLLQGYANQAAHQLELTDNYENIWNYAVDLEVEIERREQAEAKNRKNAARLQSLVRILQYQTDDVQTFLVHVLDEALQLTDSEFGYIYFYSEENQEFTLNTWSKGVMEACSITDPQIVCQLEETGIWGEVVRQRQAIIVNDFHAPHPLKKGYPEGHAPLQSFLTVPVLSAGKIVAVIGVANRATGYDQDDVVQLTLLMDSVWKEVEAIRTEHLLAESEARFRNIMASMNDMVMTLDKDQRCTGVYGPWIDQLGLEPEHFLGRTAGEFLGKENAATHQHANAKALSGEYVVYDWSVQSNDITFHYQTSLSPIYGENGVVQGLVSVGRDITETKKAQEAVRQNEEKLQSIFRVAPTGIGVVNDRVLIEVNPRVCEMTGYTKDELIGQNTRMLYPSQADFDFVGREKYRQIAENGTGMVETRWQRKDGTIIDILLASTALDAADLAKGVIFTALDITERKQAELALREQQELLSAIYRNAPLVLMVVDADRRIRQVNGFASEFAGRDVEDMISLRGGEALRCLHAMDNPKGCGYGEYCRQCEIRNTVLDTLKTGEIHLNVETAYHFADENTVFDMTFLTSTTPIQVKGEPMVLVTLQDISDRKRAQAAVQESERFLKSTIDGLSAHIVVLDETGEIILTNKAYREFAEQNGIEAKAVSEGINYLTVCDSASGTRSDEAAPFAKGIRRVLSGERQYFELEYPCHSQDERRWFTGRVTPFIGEGPRLAIVAHENITERKLAEDSLRQSEEKYRLLAENAIDVIWQMDLRLRFTYVTPSVYPMTGYTPEEWIGTKLSQHATFKEFMQMARKAITAIKNYKTFDKIVFDAVMLKKDGSSFPVEISSSLLYNKKGLPIGLQGSTRDITERKQAEVQIQHLNLVLRAIRDVNQLITQESDHDTLLQRACEILVSTRGYRSAWVAVRNAEGRLETVSASGLGKDFEIIKQSMEQGDWPDCYQCVLATPEGMMPVHSTTSNCEACPLSSTYQDSTSLIGKLRYTGHDFGILVVSLPEGLSNDEEEQSLFGELIGDISYALHAMETDQARIRHERTLQAVFHSASDGMLLADSASQRFVLANQSMCQMLGYTEDELIAMAVTDIHPKESLDAVLESFRKQANGETTLSENVPLLRKDGSVFLADINAAVLELNGSKHTLGIFRDTTERKRAEEEREQLQMQLMQSQKLQAIGQLAGGIAHDFNNIMAVIILHAGMLARSKGLTELDIERVSTITQQGWHASRLIRQILDFSRQAVLEQQPLDLLPLLKEQVKLLERTLPERIVISLQVDEGEYVVNADLTRMQQVIMNLAINARDAMPSGGTLRIKLKHVTIEPGKKYPLPGIVEGDWIKLIVSDTGTGIEPAVLSRIFEPFFTTKEQGKGTGLGLAQVHGIVGQHGGHVDVRTQVGKGTTFYVYLPALKTRQIEVAAPDDDTLPQGNGEVILVVEDGKAVRDAIVMSLVQMNYQILQATNGAEALAVMQEHGDQVALVLSDVVMPVMGGIDLLHALREAGWQTPVILLTGHAMGQDLDTVRALGLTDWLPKPPSLEQLARTIASALSK